MPWTMAPSAIEAIESGPWSRCRHGHAAMRGLDPRRTALGRPPAVPSAESPWSAFTFTGQEKRRSWPRPSRNGASRPVKQLKPGECLCDFCTGVCCRYFSLPIDNPKTWDEFDTIRWYLAHGQTVIYVEKEQWYLLVMTRCQYLRADNRCGIYLNRPKICREYTTDHCEYDDGWSFEKIFETPGADLGICRGRAAASPQSRSIRRSHCRS